MKRGLVLVLAFATQTWLVAATLYEDWKEEFSRLSLKEHEANFVGKTPSYAAVFTLPLRAEKNNVFDLPVASRREELLLRVTFPSTGSRLKGFFGKTQSRTFIGTVRLSYSTSAREFEKEAEAEYFLFSFTNPSGNAFLKIPTRKGLKTEAFYLTRAHDVAYPLTWADLKTHEVALHVTPEKTRMVLTNLATCSLNTRKIQASQLAEGFNPSWPPHVFAAQTYFSCQDENDNSFSSFNPFVEERE